MFANGISHCRLTATRRLRSKTTVGFLDHVQERSSFVFRSRTIPLAHGGGVHKTGLWGAFLFSRAGILDYTPLVTVERSPT